MTLGLVCIMFFSRFLFENVIDFKTEPKLLFFSERETMEHHLIVFSGVILTKWQYIVTFWRTFRLGTLIANIRVSTTMNVVLETRTLTNNTDYTYTIKNNINAGNASVII